MVKQTLRAKLEKVGEKTAVARRFFPLFSAKGARRLSKKR
jgi:hypothetical protein